MRRTVWRVGLAVALTRTLGVGRTVAVAVTFGAAGVADAYNLANNLPMMLFLLLGGGALGSVFVPGLVRQRMASDASFNEYATMLMVAMAGFGALITIALLATRSTVLNALSGDGWPHDQFALAYTLSAWCLPQVFFLALFTAFLQVLAAREEYLLASLTPVFSRLLVVVGCSVIASNGWIDPGDPATVGSGEAAIIGGATLAGTALQSLLLVTGLRRIGFKPAWPRTLRGWGLRATARSSSYAVLATVCFQVASLVLVAIASRAGAAAERLGDTGHSYSALFYALIVVSTAEAVLVSGLGSVLLTDLSRDHARGTSASPGAELSLRLNQLLAVAFPLAAMIAAASWPLAGLLAWVTHGDTVAVSFLGAALALLAVSLPAYALHSITTRAYYALGAASPPFSSAARIAAGSTFGYVTSFAMLPTSYVGLGCCASFAAAYWIDIPFKLRRLRLLTGCPVDLGLRSTAGAMITALLSGCVAVAAAQRMADADPPSRWLQVLTLVALPLITGAIYTCVTWRTKYSLRRFASRNG